MHSSKLDPVALLIDDSPSVLAAMSRVVRRIGFKIAAYPNPTDALRCVEAGERFALVVCDMHMPEMDGLEFRRRALLEWPDVDSVFAFVTGAADEDLALKLGSAAFFTKPVDAEFFAFARACHQRFEARAELVRILKPLVREKP